MNNVNFNDPAFMQTYAYQDFISENPKLGYLNIRAYAANSAIPIANMQVEVSKIINNQKVIFFEGATTNSGTITQISLPTPMISNDDLIAPKSTTYDIKAIYNDETLLFKIQMYSDIQVVQNINVVPNLRKDGINYGR